MKTILLCLVLFLSQIVTAQNPYQSVDSLMATYTKPVKNKEDLRDLWYFIYQRVYTDSLRLRAAVDWIAANIAYDVKALQTGNEQAGELDYALRRKKAVCAGYASLLKYFCDMFRIECEVVIGKARAFGSDVCMTGTKFVDDHAWNVVKINDQWRLVDPTWIAGSVNGDEYDPKAKFQQEFNEVYYFTPPQRFILNHFPRQSKYQLLSPAVNEKTFRNSPLFFSSYVKSDITDVKPIDPFIKTKVGDTLTFRFRSTYLTSQMVAWSETQKKATHFGETKESEGYTEFNYPVTVSGSYVLMIGETIAGRGTPLMAYKLEVEPKKER